MAGFAPEGSQYDVKMQELLTDDEQDFFDSYDEFFDSFDATDLEEHLLRGICAYDFEKPSAIQQRDVVPACKGLDVIQQAQSGTSVKKMKILDVIQQPQSGTGLKKTKIRPVLGKYPKRGNDHSRLRHQTRRLLKQPCGGRKA